MGLSESKTVMDALEDGFINIAMRPDPPPCGNLSGFIWSRIPVGFFVRLHLWCPWILARNLFQLYVGTQFPIK